MTIQELKQLISKAPDTPGVYRFQDAQKQDLYIGKASSIKKRLASYLKTTDSRIQKMIAAAKRFTFIETDSDIEAIILESRLIKQRRPPFNIMLRDDKQYFFVVFTGDKFPHVCLTHQPTGYYIGPFTDGTSLKATLRYLRNIFPYCTCKQKHRNFCLNYHIGKCLGFCCLEETNPEFKILNLKLKNKYKQNIKALQDILNGRHSTLVKELKKEMAIAGQKHDFVKAIELRTKLERLEQVFHNAQIIKYSEIIKSYSSGLPKLLKKPFGRAQDKPIIRIEGYDISNIQGAHATGSMVTFINGLPDKNFYRKFNIKTVHGANDTAMFSEILKRRLNHPEWPFPDLILIDGGKGQVSSALAVLKDMSISIPVIGLSKNARHVGHQLVIPRRKQLFPLAKLRITDKNLLIAIDAEAHRFAISHYRRQHGKSVYS